MCGKEKKILILGGSYQHNKLVECARKMGIETYVADNLETSDSPAKRNADHAIMCDLFNVDGLEKLCRKEKIDGAIGPYLDAAQLPYSELCERMGYTCFADRKTYEKFVDKKKFNVLLKENGMKTIEEYDVGIFEKNTHGDVEYPVIVKPSDSRGSKGQKICYSLEEVQDAIKEARRYSKTEEVIIQKYLKDGVDLEFEYIIIDGEPELFSMGDRCVGSKGSGIETLNTVSLLPSVFYSEYMDRCNNKVVSFLKKTGISDSPVFLQGIFCHGDMYFYDPGLRFMGDDRHLLWKKRGKEVLESILSFALGGKLRREKMQNVVPQVKGALIYPAVRPGRIKDIIGLEAIGNNKDIISIYLKYGPGDKIEEYGDLRQRFGEFVIRGEDNRNIVNTVKWLFERIKIIDEAGKEMLYEQFNISDMQGV